MSQQTWLKKGWILGARPELRWSQLYALIPCPYLSEQGVLRVYYSTTDTERVGYVTYADLDPDNPSRIVKLGEHPVLGPGEAGSFDDCGVNATSILRIGGRLMMFFVGYQRTEKTPYLLFSGAAVQERAGEGFVRLSSVPMLDRITGEATIRSAPTVLPLPGGGYRAWYVAASRWDSAPNGKRFPVYGIHTVRSSDGLNWTGPPIVCLTPDYPAETGLGRPYALYEDGRYRLWFSARSLSERGGLVYRKIGFAESSDGLRWERNDRVVRLGCSEFGWDSEMICYPAVIAVGAKRYLFYNGNGNGLAGFGYAELDT